jgi:hypothetical protein
MIKMIDSKALDNAIQKEFNSKNNNLHAYNVEYMLTNHAHALEIHLSNLINTYGINNVQAILSQLSIKQVRKAG